MKILQLVSDWKWTGPAEPMLILSGALRKRGHEVELVCPRPPVDSNRSLWHEAAQRGLHPAAEIPAQRSAFRIGDGRLVRSLKSWLGSEAIGGPFDIVHVWHSRDHVLAQRALRAGGEASARGRAALVRSDSAAGERRDWPWNRFLFGPGADGLLCVCEQAAISRERFRHGRPTLACLGAVDETRLVPALDPLQVRAGLGVAPDAPLLGVVARMQPHRRFELILEAFASLLRGRPDAKLVILGRGTHLEEVVRSPARRMGIESSVVFAGYRVDDYSEVLSTMDLLTYLVPGSDGSCRALLEAAFLGVPLVGSRRGAIPEIVREGETGLLVEEEATALAAAWLAMLDDPAWRRSLGESAAQDARIRFVPDRLAADAERLYADAIGASSPRASAARIP